MNGQRMKVQIGCEFEWESSAPRRRCGRSGPGPRSASCRRAGSPTPSWAGPSTATPSATSATGSSLPAGTTTLTYDATVEVSDHPDPVDIYARQVPVEELPADALVFLLPSRFCQSDLLFDDAWKLFGHIEPGWTRVQAVVELGARERHAGRPAPAPPPPPPATSSSRGEGVCRDFAHLALTFCRSLNIPARYVFGYLPDIAVPPPYPEMDFCAWFEVYLGDRWWTFDPRNNTRRIGRVVIGRGRDAADVAMVTTYGAPGAAADEGLGRPGMTGPGAGP